MKTLKLQKGIIYGPINSRRLGSSLGINLSPNAYKLCSFNCIYCQYGKTKVHTLNIIRNLSDLPTKEQVKDALEDWLKKGEKVGYITFSGNGEPTLHPEFDKIVDEVIKLRDKYLPQAKVAILSNSSNVSLPEVKKALKKLDLRIMKLDCGTKEMFEKMNSPAKGIEYEELVDDLKELKNIIIQSVFIGGEVTNTKPDEVEEWIERLRYILPKKIQIYSLDRPFIGKSISKVDRYVLSKIAELASELSGIEVEVY
jgi:wyosine [tRNA(Phe)-imidazoG37] synthetase (radical SAM superfamily)